MDPLSPVELDLFRINEQAFERATDLVPYMWYAFDNGHQVAGPRDNLPALYSSAREAGVRLTPTAYVAQKDNPRSNHITIG